MMIPEELNIRITRFHEKHAEHIAISRQHLVQDLGRRRMLQQGVAITKSQKLEFEFIRTRFHGFDTKTNKNYKGSTYQTGIIGICLEYFSSHPDELTDNMIQELRSMWDESMARNVSNAVASSSSIISGPAISNNQKHQLEQQIRSDYVSKWKECIGDLIQVLQEQKDRICFDKKKLAPSTKIDVLNIKGVTVIGNGNIVNAHYTEFYNSLDDLKNKILESDIFTLQEKNNINADLQTIQTQLAKEKPNKSIVMLAWEGIKGLVTAKGFYDLLKSISNFIDSIPI